VSGSGPTLWVLYPSAAAADAAATDVRRGIDDGSLVAPGVAPPSIIATTIATPAPIEPQNEIAGHATEG
jgi:hypothetical protein